MTKTASRPVGAVAGGPATNTRTRFAPLMILLGTAVSNCGGEVHVGSDVVWSARHESGDLSEWTSAGPVMTPEPVLPNTRAASGEHAYRGGFSAKFAIFTTTPGRQEGTSLAHFGALEEAYYSAWYFLPRTVAVGEFWVIMKLRSRRIAGDATTSRELYDLNLRNLGDGRMSLRLYDFDKNASVPLDVPDAPDPVVVPVAKWFHIEVFYRNADGAAGRLTYWLNDRQILDVQGRMSDATDWVGWEVCSVGEDLEPTNAVLYVDDAAISATRVGVGGILAR